MGKVRVSLNIPSHRFLAYYEGTVEDVVTMASDGRRVRFPARVLRPYLTHRGIFGTFVITFDSRHRFQSIERVAPDDPG